jgi:hypothetical protein
LYYHDDLVDAIAGIQVCMRILGWTLDTPRVANYLLAVHNRWVFDNPAICNDYPLPWNAFSRMPDYAIVALAYRIMSHELLQDYGICNSTICLKHPS